MNGEELSRAIRACGNNRKEIKNVVAYSVSTFGPKEELSNREKYSPKKSKKPF